MFTFAWPWIFVLLPLPWFVHRFMPPATTTEPALLIPFFKEVELLANQNTNSASGWKRALLILIWLLIVLACSRPQWIGEPDQIPVTGRDLVIAVDVSGSMKAEDMEISGDRVNRLIAVKDVAREFISSRKGDRIGLILFGTHAYLQSPLSFDLKTVNTLLQEAAIGIAGEKTAIGDAVGLAIKRLSDNNITSNSAAEESAKDLSRKVLILMTDGANTSGVIDPLKAADLAATAKLKIYTIGVGADSMVVNSIFGQRQVNPSSDLDETTLTEMARLTGGRFFRARDTESLSDIYTLIDQLEPINEDSRYLRPVDELFYWFVLGAALIILLAILFYFISFPQKKRSQYGYKEAEG